MSRLVVKGLRKRFGGLEVLKGVSFEVNGPELIGLIGPNGAGKTTLTNILDGAIKPNSGTVYLNDQRIDQLQPYEVARAGLGRTFQVTRSFRRLSVLENLYVPALAMNREPNKRVIRDKAMTVLEFLTIAHLRNEYAQALSGGQQKLLELGRLLMLDPDIIILDEPFAGVHPRLMEVIYDYIRRVNNDGKALIIISHQMDSIFNLSQRLLVLNYGDLIADGKPEDVKRDPAVIKAYLGSDDDDDAQTDEKPTPGRSHPPHPKPDEVDKRVATPNTEHSVPPSNASQSIMGQVDTTSSIDRRTSSDQSPERPTTTHTQAVPPITIIDNDTRPDTQPSSRAERRDAPQGILSTPAPKPVSAPETPSQPTPIIPPRPRPATSTRAPAPSKPVSREKTSEQADNLSRRRASDSTNQQRRHPSTAERVERERIALRQKLASSDSTPKEVLVREAPRKRT